ncbi:sulfatase-like hydrolase/transferase [Nitratireductor luteus]|uniref:sulfatase-like hydrolase/transferase n=1 Tax=Nitratireductor luteus TaxID=2976980 RepID=UPI00223F887C|nr:sulfatase-like hydrolase/transferase [Nitratireductor luteus]
MAGTQRVKTDGVSRGKKDKGTRSYPLHPFLFALASVLAVMANGLNQITFTDAAPALAGVLVFALVIYLAVAAVRQDFGVVTTVVATVWIVGCLFYVDLFGRLNRMLDGGYAMVVSLPFALIALILLTLLVLRIRRWLGAVDIVLNCIAVVMFVTPAWQAVAYNWRNDVARFIYDADRAAAQVPGVDAPEKETLADAANRPDIYHFIFDRYASEGILKRHYNFDNRAIGRFLEDRGFYVARLSNSNYQKTGHSLASTFYMDYLDLLADAQIEGGNWRPIYAMLDDHRVGRFLKSRGYEFIQFGSWWGGTFDSSLADENRPHGFSEFNMIYLRRTILRPLFHALPDTDLTMRLDWDNAQCQRVSDQIAEIKEIGERDHPLYVFAHILVPHGPFVFAPDGRCLSQKEAAERGSAQGYVDQIAYANQIIREIVATLQSRDTDPPVILIQADEGPFPEHDWKGDWHEAPADALQIKTGILNAYYFPNSAYDQLFPDITSVNTYRVVFNAHFGTDYSLLPDRIFAFPNTNRLYEFHDVTDTVRGSTEEEPAGTAPDNDQAISPPATE